MLVNKSDFSSISSTEYKIWSTNFTMTSFSSFDFFLNSDDLHWNIFSSNCLYHFGSFKVNFKTGFKFWFSHLGLKMMWCMRLRCLTEMETASYQRRSWGWPWTTSASLWPRPRSNQWSLKLILMEMGKLISKNFLVLWPTALEPVVQTSLREYDV